MIDCNGSIEEVLRHNTSHMIINWHNVLARWLQNRGRLQEVVIEVLY